jgi:hypothetical protein
MSPSGAQDAQSFEILEAGRSAGSALHRPACGDRHSSFGRSGRRPFGEHRARRTRHRVPHRKVRPKPGVKTAALLIRPTRAAPIAANSVFCRRTPDFNRNEHLFAKANTRLGKYDARNVNEAGDKIGASAIVPPPRSAPITSKLANTLQPETITLGS